MADQWGLVDEDGDGIIVDQVRGEGYVGYMMVVLDPSRVIMGCVPENFGVRSYTVAQMAEKFGAVAAINAGGFLDEGGTGRGETPDSMVVYEGKVYYAESGVRLGFVGLDKNHIMHVGNLYPGAVRERGIQYGVAFGPVLVANGEMTAQAKQGSGVTPPHRHRSALRRRDPYAGHRRPSAGQSGREFHGFGGDYDRIWRCQCLQSGRRILLADVLQR